MLVLCCKSIRKFMSNLSFKFIIASTQNTGVSIYPLIWYTNNLTYNTSNRWKSNTYNTFLNLHLAN